MTSRTQIPEDLAAKVLFASDHTCCICREQSREVQIHHIDGDRSHNSFENLAVLCLEDHARAHRQGSFTRNLSSEEVGLYNQSWREIVQDRNAPETELSGLGEYRQEVLLEISLTCHFWKNEYLRLYPAELQSAPDDKIEFSDIWEWIIKTANHRYSEHEWERYRSLFDDTIQSVIHQIEHISMIHSSILTPLTKTYLIRTTRNLRTERRAYLSLPVLPDFNVIDMDGFFRARFTSVAQILSQLDYEARRLRESR